MLCLTLPLVFAVLASPASYRSLRPYELIIRADLIVQGTILHADHPRVRLLDKETAGSTFLLKVNRRLVGTSPSSELEVRQFADWMCAARYAPYEVGQQAVFHLWRPRDEAGHVDPSAPWQVLGAGNEGELPVLEESVLCRSGWPREGREEFSLSEHGFSAVPVPLDEYSDAASALSRCYAWDPQPKDRRHPSHDQCVVPLCPDAELLGLAKDCPTLKFLTSQIAAELSRHR